MGVDKTTFGSLEVENADEGFLFPVGFTLPGDLAVADDLVVFTTPVAGLSLIKAEAHAKTAPTGADAILVVEHEDSDDVATLTIAATEKKAEDTDIGSEAEDMDLGDQLAINVNQIGSSAAGADVDVVLWFLRKTTDAATS